MQSSPLRTCQCDIGMHIDITIERLGDFSHYYMKGCMGQ